MPTAVSVARQCLTQEAAEALDEAVAVARRRGHSQTTSLHAVSALFSLPSSSLRDACARARNAAYSPRLQFKALELCLSVSLDRVPSASSQLNSNDPPVSNSFMAAIKRSQANQRRQPENFHLYRDMSQQNPNPSNISCVKVELKHLILSILDDPVVSRVFGEAGFRSSDIKLAIIRPLPLPNLLRYSRPVFLCNFENSDPPRRGFSFPFPGAGGEENSRRIGEVLARRRNPLLVGICAYDALASFTESVEKNRHGFLVEQVSKLNIISIEDYISKYIKDGFNKGEMDLKFKEMSRVMEGGYGWVVNYGDLKHFLHDDDDKDGQVVVDDDDDGINYVIRRLTRLLQVYGGKVWVLGAAASYQTYLKFVNRFPCVEKDWDLQILPITCLKTSVSEPLPKSSLMESFVPFGGFFSTPSELKSSSSSSYQHVPRCQLCNERCEQEVIAISKGGFNASVADQYRFTLPSLLQMTELGDNKGLDVKTIDDAMLLRSKVAGLQKKWDSICQRLHHTHPVCQSNPPFPTVLGFDQKENARAPSSNKLSTLALSNEKNSVKAVFQNIPTSQSNIPFTLVSKTKNGSFLNKLQQKLSKEGDFEEPVSPCSLSNSSLGDISQASPTTDLGLGICSASSSNLLKKPTDQNHKGIGQDLSAHLPANVDVRNGSVCSHPVHSSSSSSSDLGVQLDPSNFKRLFAALTERVDWQDEAVTVISQTVVERRARNEKCPGGSRRGDIWLNFSGPDRCGKKKIAVALADMIYGSRENFIFMDLSIQDGDRLFNFQEGNYDFRFRGKTLVDYIAEELSKKPLSVVYLENVDKADIQVQSSLSQAIRTGKFLDSRGREVSTNNAIFVTTSTLSKENEVACYKTETSNYYEDKILRANAWSLQILIKPEGNKELMVPATTRESICKQSFLNKRKLLVSHETLEQCETLEVAKRPNRTSYWNLDLNIPAQVLEADQGAVDNDCVPEHPTLWLQNFLGQSVRNVVFKPFDFDALAEKVLNDIHQSFRKCISSECLLEIDSKVMEQLLVAAYTSDENRLVSDWVGKVLSNGFVEVEKRYNLNTHSVVKLVATHNLSSEEKTPTPGVCLPLKIILN